MHIFKLIYMSYFAGRNHLHEMNELMFNNNYYNFKSYPLLDFNREFNTTFNQY